MDAPRVVLDELFFSLQGEGALAGCPQLFLRLAGCPLRCRYCDTPRSWVRTPFFERHEARGTTRRANPLGAEEVAAELDVVAASHGVGAGGVTLAVTGGEPLDQTEFLAAWLPTWPAPVLLETAGLWPERLGALLPHLRYVSLDWKLPSTLRSGRELVRAGACAALAVAAGRETWVKVVVTQDTPDGEIAAALEELARCAPGVRAYLQPATPFGRGPGPPAPERLLQWALRFRGLGLDLRVQPQLHPLLGVR